ncbi:MAG: hypothetical protein ACRBB0_18410 [Pelagimonas sp.]|uniref:hypothetical protein n=1 Tax=Pelagimonas sp. TaxID=2073170 RepID=UPI003D6C2057
MILRSLSAYALVLILALTSQTMAVAQGQAAAMGEMEICQGLGVVSVPVDAEGNPTGAPMICPDFAGVLALDALPAPVGPSLNAWIKAGYALETFGTYGRAAPAASARGPPEYL